MPLDVAAELRPAPAAALAAPPAHKQLYQILWGAVAVFFGCLLPLNDQAVGWKSDTFDPALVGPIGLMTVGGSVSAFAALLTIGAQIYCIRYRKLMLSPIVLMLLVAIWSWMHIVPGFAAGGQFMDNAGMRWTALLQGKIGYFSDLMRHLGHGYLFATIGSSFVVLMFLKEVLGLGARKKKPGDPATNAKGRGRRR